MTGSPTQAARMWLSAGLLALLAILVIVWQWHVVFWQLDDPLGDLAIYRGAVTYVVDGGSLYDYVFEHATRAEGYSFTYPPFAALIFLPLAVIPAGAANVLWSLSTSMIAIAVGVLVAQRSTERYAGSCGSPEGLARRVISATVAILIVITSYPYVHNFLLGEVSLAITALALFDVSGAVPRRWQGVLTGIGSAVKLTPLIFIPYYFFTRQFRQAALSLGVFVGASVLGHLVFPGDSWAFWSDRILNTGHVGELWFSRNKSVMGLLSRWLEDSGVVVVWIVIAAVVGLLALKKAVEYHQDGCNLQAALVMGCASVAISPISWPHHQIWAGAAAAFLVLQTDTPRRVIGWVLVSVFLFVSPLQGLSDGGSLLFRLAQELPSLVFPVIAVVGLGDVMGSEAFPRRPSR